MKKFLQEFKDFALRGNVLDMAIGIIIGTAIAGLVTSLTDNFITPIIKLCTGAETYTLQNATQFASNFGGAVVNFIILAFILFCIIKFINKLTSLGSRNGEGSEPATKICEFCQSEIPANATRCPHCTSELK